MHLYHAEIDYRRYSGDGLVKLASAHQFEMVEMFPVHTLAQTIAWIWWSHLVGKRKRFQLVLLWLSFNLPTRFSCKTDFSLVKQPKLRPGRPQEDRQSDCFVEDNRFPVELFRESFGFGYFICQRT